MNNVYKNLQNTFKLVLNNCDRYYEYDQIYDVIFYFYRTTVYESVCE